MQIINEVSSNIEKKVKIQNKIYKNVNKKTLDKFSKKYKCGKATHIGCKICNEKKMKENINLKMEKIFFKWLKNNNVSQDYILNQIKDLNNCKEYIQIVKPNKNITYDVIIKGNKKYLNVNKQCQRCVKDINDMYNSNLFKILEKNLKYKNILFFQIFNKEIQSYYNN